MTHQEPDKTPVCPCFNCSASYVLNLVESQTSLSQKLLTPPPRFYPRNMANQAVLGARAKIKTPEQVCLTHVCELMVGTQVFGNSSESTFTNDYEMMVGTQVFRNSSLMLALVFVLRVMR
ncbi:hypothetical protein RRG08_038284 [Elysia crispata]|uniref:Uncharacterized protein n=1 Tax=Elysia crispata TaxID=231223 RepID=A0AAE1AN64_9GAST|nr:hypothetical protein RRG08_038284 [Elysia crispata]